MTVALKRDAAEVGVQQVRDQVLAHVVRRYGLGRTRLKGHEGAKTWAAWAILAYNLDTLAIRSP